MSIVEDKPVPGTCAVCGKPISTILVGLPKLPGMVTQVCSQCGKEVCSEHIKGNVCLKCSGGKDWCGTQTTRPHTQDGWCGTQPALPDIRQDIKKTVKKLLGK